MVPGENEQSIRSFLRLLQFEPAIVSDCLNSVDKTVPDKVNSVNSVNIVNNFKMFNIVNIVNIS